jgi:hypothetical protein
MRAARVNAVGQRVVNVPRMAARLRACPPPEGRQAPAGRRVRARSRTPGSVRHRARRTDSSEESVGKVRPRAPRGTEGRGRPRQRGVGRDCGELLACQVHVFIGGIGDEGGHAACRAHDGPRCFGEARRCGDQDHACDPRPRHRGDVEQRQCAEAQADGEHTVDSKRVEHGDDVAGASSDGETATGIRRAAMAASIRCDHAIVRPECVKVEHVREIAARAGKAVRGHPSVCADLGTSDPGRTLAPAPLRFGLSGAGMRGRWTRLWRIGVRWAIHRESATTDRGPNE